MSVLIGAICLRRTEVYFSMLTLAFAQLGFFIALQWNSVTGGDDGLAGIPVSTLELGFTTLELNGLRDPLTFFIVTAVIVLLTFAALILFTESPMGRCCRPSARARSGPAAAGTTPAWSSWSRS